jgi:predicted PurR-regulated permease PerM
MIGLSRTAARYTWTAAAVLLGLGLLYTIRSTLFVFVIALLFAYLLYPLVNLLDRALPAARTRGLALALAYLIFISVVVLLGMEIGVRVVDQAQLLIKKFPEMAAQWDDSAAQSPTDLKSQIIHNVRIEVARRANDIIHLLPAAGIKLMSVAGELVYIVIVPILAFFFLKDSYVIRSHILELVDAGPWRARLDNIMADVHYLLAHYMRALVLLSLATFVCYSIFFVIAGVPFGVLLAVVAMFLEFIPMIGPLTAAVAIVLVSALSGSHVLAVIVFLVFFRMFQDYVLSPHLMGQGVELHPLLVLFGVFAGAEVAGVAGSFLSVPVLALARIIYINLRRARLATVTPAPAAAHAPTQLVG